MFKSFSVIATLAMFCTNASFAEHKVFTNDSFDVLMGGEFSTEVGGRIQKDKYTKRNVNGGINKAGVTANNKHIGMDSRAAAHITAQNMNNKDFSYGIHMGMKTTTRSNESAGKGKLERSYIFLEGEQWGRSELGANVGTARAMSIKGNSVDAGENSWDTYVSLNSFSPSADYSSNNPEVQESNFLTSAKMVLQESKYESNHEAFRKVTYYTPKINGVQFGISYIPDASNKGGFAVYPNQNNETKANEKNAFSTGVTWEKVLGKDHYVETALVGEIGNQKAATGRETTGANQGLFHRSEAFIIGTKYVKDKMSFALAYGNRGKSGFKKNIAESNVGGPIIKPGATYFYNIGTAYQICDKTAVSLTYLHTEKNKNTLDLIYLGANYNMAQGVKTYAEVSYFTGKQKRNYKASYNGVSSAAVMETNQNFKINGSALVTGIKITF